MQCTEFFLLQNDVYNKHPTRWSPAYYGESQPSAAWLPYLSGCGSASQNERHSLVTLPASEQSLPLQATNTWFDAPFLVDTILGTAS